MNNRNSWLLIAVTLVAALIGGAVSNRFFIIEAVSAQRASQPQPAPEKDPEKAFPNLRLYVEFEYNNQTTAVIVDRCQYVIVPQPSDNRPEIVLLISGLVKKSNGTFTPTPLDIYIPPTRPIRFRIYDKNKGEVIGQPGTTIHGK